MKIFFCGVFIISMFFSQFSNALVCSNSASTNQDDYNLNLSLSHSGIVYTGSSLTAQVQTSWLFISRTSSGNYPIEVTLYLDGVSLGSQVLPSGSGIVTWPIAPLAVGFHSVKVVTNQSDRCQITNSFEVRNALTPPTGQISGEIQGVSSNGKVWGWVCENGNKSPRSPQFFIGYPNSYGPYEWAKSLRADKKSDITTINHCNSTGEYFNFEFTFTSSEMTSFCNRPISGHFNGVYLSNSGQIKVPCPQLTPINKGQIQSVSGGVLTGWACINGISQSASVDIFAGVPEQLGNSNRLATITANSASSASVSTTCNTFGVPHGIYYVFSSAEKELHCGKALYVVPRNSNIINGVIGDSTPAAGSGAFNIPCN